MHDESMVQRLAQLIQGLGLLQVAYRSDQEAALTSMFDAACRLSGRKALPVTAEQEGQAVELMRQEDAKEAAVAASSSTSYHAGRLVAADLSPSSSSTALIPRRRRRRVRRPSG